MDVGLAVAGLISLVLGLAHETLGVVWVLPATDKDHLRATRFGSPRFTFALLSASWHLITVFVLCISVILLVFAWVPAADPETIVLRVFAAGWVVAAVVASSSGLRQVRDVRALARTLVRFPVPLFFVVVGILCWEAAS